jgi:hypothetical protein
MNTIEVESAAPARRVGFLGEERREVLEVDDHTYAYSGGAGPAMASLASTASGASEGPAQAEPVAAKLAVLERLLGDSPFRFLVPGPLGLPVDTPLGMVLARQETFGFSVSPAPPPGKVELRLALTGEFPSTIEANGRQLLGSFFASDLGRALVGDYAPTVLVETREQSVLVSVELDTDRLATGLQYIFTAGVSDLL